MYNNYSYIPALLKARNREREKVLLRIFILVHFVSSRLRSRTLLLGARMHFYTFLSYEYAQGGVIA